jgi:hypothetical protein
MNRGAGAKICRSFRDRRLDHLSELYSKFIRRIKAQATSSIEAIYANTKSRDKKRARPLDSEVEKLPDAQIVVIDDFPQVIYALDIALKNHS